jgi:hypothetical protein
VLAAGLAGCVGGDDGAVTVATDWPAAERARIEEGFRQSSGLSASWRIRWVLLAPGDDSARLARRRTLPDVLLGGPASAFARLDAEGALELPEGGAPAWRVVRRGPSSHRSEQPVDRGLGDPRRDPFALAWAREQLQSGPWAEGYARLVRGSGMTPAAATSEGIAILKDAPHAEAARAFVRSLEQSGQVIAPGPDDRKAVSSDADGLLADLLGATLVEAQEELVAAWDALGRAGHPARAEAWMTAPPPWPPASVAKLLQDESNAMPLVETLAAQVAPEADARAWLLRSWIAPARAVDGTLLDELAGAVGGRLAREPRFRAWLRSEWTAWARQRYRRVARTAEGGWVPPTMAEAPVP